MNTNKHLVLIVMLSCLSQSLSSAGFCDDRLLSDKLKDEPSFSADQLQGLEDKNQDDVDAKNKLLGPQPMKRESGAPPENGKRKLEDGTIQVFKDGKLILQVEPDGARVWKFKYDKKGALVKITGRAAEGSKKGVYGPVLIELDVASGTVTETYASGETREYDLIVSFGTSTTPIRIDPEDPPTHFLTTIFDTAFGTYKKYEGHLKKATFPDGTVQYFKKGRIVSQEDSGYLRSFEYDTDGKLVRITSVSTNKNKYGTVKSVIDLVAGTVEEYFANGEKRSYELSVEFYTSTTPIRFRPDWTLYLNVPGSTAYGTGTHYYARLKSVAFPDGVVQDFKEGRLVKQTEADRVLYFEYDADGNLLRITSESSSKHGPVKSVADILAGKIVEYYADGEIREYELKSEFFTSTTPVREWPGWKLVYLVPGSSVYGTGVRYYGLLSYVKFADGTVQYYKEGRLVTQERENYVDSFEYKGGDLVRIVSKATHPLRGGPVETVIDLVRGEASVLDAAGNKYSYEEVRGLFATMTTPVLIVPGVDLLLDVRHDTEYGTHTRYVGELRSIVYAGGTPVQYYKEGRLIKESGKQYDLNFHYRSDGTLVFAVQRFKSSAKSILFDFKSGIARVRDDDSSPVETIAFTHKVRPWRVAPPRETDPVLLSWKSWNGDGFDEHLIIPEPALS